ncbi:MAG: putative DNA binding domain-containing protein [Candidatus Margulisbacteria bacterium]|nr:putative DNA binding domain-containing protein [Candidatus Margulisiibacteriota bacterium]
MRSANELIKHLNSVDECTDVEAKRCTKVDKSILETICSFSNEPGLGGGSILLGVVRSKENGDYESNGISNPDQIQSDLASRCATEFNVAIRPRIKTEVIGGNTVLNVSVSELSKSQKPLYFKSVGLPKGAFRRIGPTDHQCTDDDMFVFYEHNDTFDKSVVYQSTMRDIDLEAVENYRRIRERVNSSAEELTYTDEDLLHSLGCVENVEGEIKLTVAGVLLFGSKMAQRRLFPMMRVDYIRIPGNEWVSNPDKRFTTIDMRGPLLSLVQRLLDSVVDDLPKGFYLPEGEIQADRKGLPGRVLREAIVNAIMHRSYKENQPIQILRYSNRIEIKNPGFSLKPEEHLGTPGSKTRNPLIAAVFHETNVAETKGSGIRVMRKLMEQSGLGPPTFESDHGQNLFTARLLLHHFLGEEDIKWLASFEKYKLNESQKISLIFVREVGAIDNSVYRQINRLDTLKASSELRLLKKCELLIKKGKGRSTYYVPGNELTRNMDLKGLNQDSAPVTSHSAPVTSHSAPVTSHSAPVPSHSAPVPTGDSAPVDYLINQLPQELKDQIRELGSKCNDPEKIKKVIVNLCHYREFRLKELAIILARQPKYILRTYLKPLLESKKIKYTQPDMPNHPNQAYTV